MIKQWINKQYRETQDKEYKSLFSVHFKRLFKERQRQIISEVDVSGPSELRVDIIYNNGTVQRFKST